MNRIESSMLVRLSEPLRLTERHASDGRGQPGRHEAGQEEQDCARLEQRNQLAECCWPRGSHPDQVAAGATGGGLYLDQVAAVPTGGSHPDEIAARPT